MTLSRRSLLAGAAALAASTRARAATDADVAVIGAGAAGLAAAAAIRRSGHSVSCWRRAAASAGGPSPRRRSGRGAASMPAGNTCTGPSATRGARSRWRRGAHLRRRHQPLAGAGEGRRAGERGRAAPAPVGFWPGERAARPSAGPDRSVAQAVAGEDEAARAAATGLTRLTLGEEPDRVSTADYDQLWSGDDIWVDGYGALVAGHYADLPVRWTRPRRDSTGAARASLSRRPRHLRAACAIVTVPVGVLASGSLRFTPDLPAATAQAVAGLTMGAYTKIGLALDLPRLRAQDLRDAVILRSGTPASPPTWRCSRSEKPLAVLHCGGDGARALCEAGEAAALGAATDHW